MPRGPLGQAAQADRTAFAEAVLDTMGAHVDVASEACWQEFARVLAQHWLVFQGDQSPLSSWGMIAKCTETILKIRMARRAMKGEGEADALEAFRSFMEEVTGDNDSTAGAA